MTRIVVVQTAWLGDLVLTTPLLRSLSRLHGPVDLVTTPDAAPLVEHNPAVSRVISFDKGRADRGVRGLRHIARVLTGGGYEAAYLPHRSVRSAAVAAWAGIPRRVGFDDAAGRWLYTHRRAARGTHEAVRLLSLLDADDDASLTVPLGDRDRSTASRALARAGITPPFVVVAPGSARRTKRWAHYPTLLKMLSSSIPVALVGAAGEAAWLGDLDLGPFPCADLTGRLALRESTAVIDAASVAVTNDSAPLHLAAAVATPVVAVFGPTSPSGGFGPRGANDLTVQIDLPCRPCSTHGANGCPLRHHKCMRDLPAIMVWDAVQHVLATGPEAVRPCG